MIPLLLLAACEVTTLSNSWGTAQVYSNCSFGRAVLVSTAGSGVTFRSVLLTQDGVLQVFDSFCSGPESRCTGARTYVLSPKPEALDVDVKEDRIRLGDLAGGRALELAKGQVSPLTISGLDGLTDVAIAEHPMGSTDLPWGAGISISRAWATLVDLGFRVGGPPQGQAERVAHVTGPAKACKDAKASDFFETRNGEIDLRSNVDVASAITAACAP